MTTLKNTEINLKYTLEMLRVVIYIIAIVSSSRNDRAVPRNDQSGKNPTAANTAAETATTSQQTLEEIINTKFNGSYIDDIFYANEEFGKMQNKLFTGRLNLNPIFWKSIDLRFGEFSGQMEGVNRRSK